MKKVGYIFFFLLLFCACAEKPKPAMNGAFAPAPAEAASDLDRLHEGGELIAGTVSGPDTYFDYQGQPMGLQYALAEDFAKKEGLRLRIEVARDERQLEQMLAKGEVDMAACQLPADSLPGGLMAAGARVDSARTSWAVRDDSGELARALDDWFGAGIEVTVERREANRMTQRRQVRRKVRAPYISKEKGIISTYDAFFKSAAHTVGWDWRLIAAQCYQESGFDPNATSWAGARGLMQIMPATAAHLGLPADRICVPADNVAAAARYIKELNGKFSDISDPRQRICFVLAAYNGGTGHVRDAMALARKHGRNSRRWDEVSPFVLGLSQPRYYRDPVVQFGYMIGSETVNYVASVLSRWQAYGGERIEAGGVGMPSVAAPERSRRQNRYTKGTRILQPDDPEFLNME